MTIGFAIPKFEYLPEFTYITNKQEIETQRVEMNTLDYANTKTMNAWQAQHLVELVQQAEVLWYPSLESFGLKCLEIVRYMDSNNLADTTFFLQLNQRIGFNGTYVPTQLNFGSENWMKSMLELLQTYTVVIGNKFGIPYEVPAF